MNENLHLRQVFLKPFSMHPSSVKLESWSLLVVIKVEKSGKIISFLGYNPNHGDLK